MFSIKYSLSHLWLCPGLDLCQEQAKDQELNSAGTELKIIFVIVTMIEISYGSNQNAKFYVKNLCPLCSKNSSYHDPNNGITSEYPATEKVLLVSGGT